MPLTTTDSDQALFSGEDEYMTERELADEYGEKFRPRNAQFTVDFKTGRDRESQDGKVSMHVHPLASFHPVDWTEYRVILWAGPVAIAGFETDVPLSFSRRLVDAIEEDYEGIVNIQIDGEGGNMGSAIRQKVDAVTP